MNIFDKLLHVSLTVEEEGRPGSQMRKIDLRFLKGKKGSLGGYQVNGKKHRGNG
jgi:hypothetical protein